MEHTVALVTGANRGIGRQFARLPPERGAKNAHATARDVERITVPGVVALPLDITDPQSVSAAAETAQDVTLLVNNVGVAHAQDVVTGDLDQIPAETETNVFGTRAMVRAFSPVRTRAGTGPVGDRHGRPRPACQDRPAREFGLFAP